MFTYVPCHPSRRVRSSTSFCRLSRQNVSRVQRRIRRLLEPLGGIMWSRETRETWRDMGGPSTFPRFVCWNCWTPEAEHDQPRLCHDDSWCIIKATHPGIDQIHPNTGSSQPKPRRTWLQPLWEDLQRWTAAWIAWIVKTGRESRESAKF